MEKREYFSSRWTLILSTLAMAVGAGNIWRFPRLAGQYGGAFLVPWVLFLIMWSIPLIMVEFAIGKSTRKGTIGAFSTFLGKRYAWMGAFVGLCTMFIMFYYSVVTGWSINYFIASITGKLTHVDQAQYWESFTSSGIWPVVFHLFSVLMAAFIIYQGVVRGIERANRILMPSLIILLLIGVVRALTLPNASVGLNYFFGIQTQYLWDYKVWLEALSQSAWSTGAGWGLILTYAVYLKKDEDITLNAFITGFGNNSASLLAGLAIIPTIFSLTASLGEAEAALRAGNQGLSFIVIPQLFAKLPGATILNSIFFLALFFAALSSLIAMFELSTRIIMDFGIRRKIALPIVAGLTALMGLPSALSMDFFNNQDWVWGLGLIVSGMFFIFAAIKYGIERFRENHLNKPYNDLRIGKWFTYLMKFLLPLEAILLLGWWFYQSVLWDPKFWWNPLKPFSLGTTIVQWGILLFALVLLNNKLNKWIGGNGG